MARTSAVKAGLPVTTAGMTINRYCSSGLQAISTAANRIIADGADVMVAGGVESISLVQNNLNTKNFVDSWLMDNKPEIYFPMLKTAEIVAQRYNVSRESQDEYALASQQRTAAGQENGKFDDEIVPITTIMDVTNKETGEVTEKEVTLSRDEGNRPSTNLEGLAALPSVTEGSISAGNSSQLSDGAAAVVLMEAKEAEKRGLQPLGLYKGLVATGCEPDEMGHWSGLRYS